MCRSCKKAVFDLIVHTYSRLSKHLSDYKVYMQYINRKKLLKRGRLSPYIEVIEDGIHTYLRILVVQMKDVGMYRM